MAVSEMNDIMLVYCTNAFDLANKMAKHELVQKFSQKDANVYSVRPYDGACSFMTGLENCLSKETAAEPFIYSFFSNQEDYDAEANPIFRVVIEGADAALVGLSL